jgi:hypothetical protein
LPDIYHTHFLDLKWNIRRDAAHPRQEGETKEVKTKEEEEKNVTEKGRKESKIVRKERRRKNR